MKHIFNTPFSPAVLFLLIIVFSCNNAVSSTDFTGIYRIKKAEALDSAAQLRMTETADWTIILARDNNFEIHGRDKNTIGYWKVENKGRQYSLLFQADGTTTTAGFDGKEIYFSQPTSLLDSIFSSAGFVKEEKE